MRKKKATYCKIYTYAPELRYNNYLRRPLSYPMMELPNRMIEKGEGAFGAVAPLFRSPVMWIGFAIPFTYFSCTGLHEFYPAVPEFPFLAAADSGCGAT